MAFMMEWIRPDEKVLTAAEVKKLPVGTKVTIVGADRRGECYRRECTVAQSYKTKVLRWITLYESGFYPIRDIPSKRYLLGRKPGNG
jgi:hypothetical protein